MPRFTSASTVKEVVASRSDGDKLLFDHGYEVGSAFVDHLSQYQSLKDAERAGRLRELPRLLQVLNQN